MNKDPVCSENPSLTTGDSNAQASAFIGGATPPKINASDLAATPLWSRKHYKARVIG